MQGEGERTLRGVTTIDVRTVSESRDKSHDGDPDGTLVQPNAERERVKAFSPNCLHVHVYMLYTRILEWQLQQTARMQVL